jgi:hypothetical protein
MGLCYCGGCEECGIDTSDDELIVRHGYEAQKYLKNMLGSESYLLEKVICLGWIEGDPAILKLIKLCDISYLEMLALCAENICRKKYGKLFLKTWDYLND